VSWVLAGIVLGTSAVLLIRLQVPQLARQSLEVAAQSFETVRDPRQGDEAKEFQLRRNALRLFRLAFGIVLLSAVSFVLPLLAVSFLSWLGLAAFDEVTRILVSPEFMVSATAAVVAVFIACGIIGRA
jgi:hypothetical protein